jgi:hypothetical protein
VESSKDLYNLANLGIWPGPGESEEAFLLRSQKELKALDDDSRGAIEYSAYLKKTLHTLFFINPLPHLASYDTTGLYFWEGAAMYSYEENGSCRPKILVSPKFKMGKHLWYDRDEVLAHEIFHAARIMYQEPKFEELLAYQTSKNRLRQILGPMFQNPLESIIFLFSVLLSLCISLSSIFIDLERVFYAQYVPIVYLMYLLLRVQYRQGLLKRAIKNIGPFLKDHSFALAFVARLTDEEIKTLAKASFEVLIEFFDRGKKRDLRMKILMSTFT